MYLSMSAAPWPKRLETTFTSSGWETSLGILRALEFLTILGKDARDAVGREIVVEVVVDLNGRSPAASADALDLFEGEDSIRRNAYVADAKLILEFLVDVVCVAI